MEEEKEEEEEKEKKKEKKEKEREDSIPDYDTLQVGWFYLYLTQHRDK